jgi:YggT family protein
MSALGIVLIKSVQLLANSMVGLIFARIVLSWVYPNVRNTVVYWVWRLTEPFLGPIRRMLPHSGSTDLSVWVALLLIFFARTLIIGFLYTWLR